MVPSLPSASLGTNLLLVVFLTKTESSFRVSSPSLSFRQMYMLLEDNRIHASFCAGDGNEFCVIFSNAKDEAWSEHKRLHGQENI
jgi:hypothetical protein